MSISEAGLLAFLLSNLGTALYYYFNGLSRNKSFRLSNRVEFSQRDVL